MAAPGLTKIRRRSPIRRAAATGLPPSGAGRSSARGPARPSRSCGSPAFTARDETRSSRSRAATPAASSSPARCSTAFMSATSRRRSTPRSRASAAGIFNIADDEPARRAIRSCSPRSFSAAIRRRKLLSPTAAPSMSPMALSFWQECRRVRNDKLKRELGVDSALPDLPRRPARTVRSAMCW